MLAYLYRFKGSDWIGVAVGNDKEDVFWVIDEAGDPYNVEIMTLRRGGVCWESKEESHVTSIEPSEFVIGAISHGNWMPNTGWREPRWSAQSSSPKMLSPRP